MSAPVAEPIASIDDNGAERITVFGDDMRVSHRGPARDHGLGFVNGWINHCRRHDRHYEFTLKAHEGFLVLSQIALLIRRLDRSQLFDTL